MEEKQASYRQLFGATSLFGGVQILNIIISIIRSKFVAVLLGPTGTGIAGLLTSTTGLITGLTNFGLGISAVKNVAAANFSGDKQRIGIVVGVMRKLVWITGLLGTIVTIALSPYLSKITFGNSDYTLGFAWISISLLINQITTGQEVILRGTRQLKHLAKASLLGSLLGLVISVPIYYKFGIDGIVPAIIIISLSSLILTWHFSRKVKIQRVQITREEIFHEGKEMLSMGFMLSISGLIALVTSYVIRIYISHAGGVDQVGLYNAGFALINTYVGMIFTAMSMDYYPRLAGVAHDNRKSSILINQQSEIAILILAPILTVFIVFIQYVIILLFSTKFVPVNEMIQWAALGMYFKTASWAIAFLLLAKGASNVFFWNELVAEVYMLGFNILGYNLAGLTGFGVSFLIGYLVYSFQVFFLVRYKYHFFLDITFVRLFVFQLIHGIACFLIIRFLPSPWSYITGIIIIFSSAFLSIKELDTRLGFKALWLNFRKGSR